ncbi:MAG TPA: L,D-transpeptidase [Baekduia sp.]|nr:L,D-transpeptidase [Baekduia sp.]
MRRITTFSSTRSAVASTIALLAACAAAATVYVIPATAQDGVHIAPGVSSGGIDLSGLTAPDAQAKLTQQLAPVLGANVTVQAGGKQFAITAAKAGFTFDAAATATRALAAPANTPVAPAATSSKPKITAEVTAIAAAVRIAPRDATIRIGLKKLKIRKAKAGTRISNANVVAAVTKAFADPTAPRVIAPKLLPAQPKTTDQELRKAFRTVITVEKRTFTLRLFKNFRVSKRYKVATGQPAYPTPSGRFTILDKAVNPTWSVPNSPWAGELQGTKVQGGSAENPLKARWMGIGNGVGFHGTGQEYSIGTRASHGCLRMRVKDVIDLYPRVPVGTAVLIR